jgi:hypothetical protein
MIGLNPRRRKDRVYITKDIAAAMFFASRSQTPKVYEVTPEGDIEDDPDHNRKGISFACPKAKIIAVYNVPQEVVRHYQQMMVQDNDRQMLTTYRCTAPTPPSIEDRSSEATPLAQPNG